MLVDARRGLIVSGVLLAGAVAIGILVVAPATHPAVQAVDDRVWHLAVASVINGTGWINVSGGSILSTASITINGGFPTTTATLSGADATTSKASSVLASPSSGPDVIRRNGLFSTRSSFRRRDGKP